MKNEILQKEHSSFAQGKALDLLGHAETIDDQEKITLEVLKIKDHLNSLADHHTKEDPLLDTEDLKHPLPKSLWQILSIKLINLKEEAIEEVVNRINNQKLSMNM